MQNAIDRIGINLEVRTYRMYGEKRSAGFEFIDTINDETLFTIDIDVNRPTVPTQIYEIEGLRFRGISPVQIIADKVDVISSDKIFRRIKDVVDLYYISKVFDFNVDDVLTTLENSGRSLDSFQGFLYRTEELEHSYEKFRFSRDVSKPQFEIVYKEVKNYIKDILPQ